MDEPPITALIIIQESLKGIAIFVSLTIVWAVINIVFSGL